MEFRTSELQITPGLLAVFLSCRLGLMAWVTIPKSAVTLIARLLSSKLTSLSNESRRKRMVRCCEMIGQSKREAEMTFIVNNRGKCGACRRHVPCLALQRRLQWSISSEFIATTPPHYGWLQGFIGTGQEMVRGSAGSHCAHCAYQGCG